MSRPLFGTARWVLPPLVLALLLPGPDAGRAALLPAPVEPRSPEQHEAARLELEAKLIRDRLRALGLTPEEIEPRVQSLDADELHQVARSLAGVQVGGEVVAILLIIGGLIAASLLLVLIAGAAEDLSAASAE